MGNFFGQLIQLLTHPVGLIVLFGLIGGLGKLGTWISHERAKRAAALARARRDDENLRTGRPITVESTLRPTPGTQAAPAATTQAERQRALQEQRAAQLRALQQKRLEELRAKRAGQQGARPGAPARQPTPAPARPQTETHTADAARAQPARHSTTRRPAPPQRMQPPVRPAQLREQASQRPSQPQLQRRQPPAPPPGTRPVEATEIGTGRELAASPYQLRGAHVSGLGPLLGAGQSLRQAIVLAEILGPPLAERDPDKPGIF